MDITKYVNNFEKELRLKFYCKQTIATYLSCVKKLLNTINDYPERINSDQIKDYLIDLVNEGFSGSLISQNIGALKLFYDLVVNQPRKLSNIERPRRGVKLIEVLSIHEVTRLINSIDNIKHKTITILLYDTALRISELLNLKLTDIKRDRNLLFIDSGKGNKDRYVTLNDNVIELLINYYYQYKPLLYIFEGVENLQYSSSSVRQFLRKYSIKVKLNKWVNPHLLRHSKLTHLHETGLSLKAIQDFAGHKSSKTTERYVHISNKYMSQIQPTLKYKNIR